MRSREREHVQEGPAVSPFTHKLCTSKDSLFRAFLKDGNDFPGGVPERFSVAHPAPLPGSISRAGRTDWLPNLRVTSSSACSAARQFSSRLSKLS